MKILLLSAYHAQSHEYWVQGLLGHLSEHQFTVLTLPPRYFSWRVRGNSLSWAMNEREVLEADYDLLIATSMVDLSALRGMVAKLSALPTWVYFHENQFSYPAGKQQQGLVDAQLTSIYTALCADVITFNSEWNRSSFISGANALLKKLPDHVPRKATIEQIEQRSDVLPVPLKPYSQAVTAHDATKPLHVVWNHRWEYDKGPDELLAIIERAELRGSTLNWSIVGQQFREQPEAFKRIKNVLDNSDSQKLNSWGYLESAEDYQQCLSAADVVLSTSLHDFQGLAILEAVQHGCVPVLPNRLCYGEWFGPEYLYDVKDSEAEAALQRLTELSGQALAAPSITSLEWPQLVGRYNSVISRLVDDRNKQ